MKKISNIIIRPKYLTSDNANKFQSWKHAINKFEEKKFFQTLKLSISVKLSINFGAIKFLKTSGLTCLLSF